MTRLLLSLIAVLFIAGTAEARKASTTYHPPKVSTPKSPKVRIPKPPKPPKVAKPTAVKTRKRSAAARGAFQRSQPCPSTGKTSGACPGYVVDHRMPLACGGADDPSNMSWQTTDEAKRKDAYERNGCR